MAYYLGIDGGGSKTTCVVGDEVASLGTAVSGASNITRVGEAGAREALHQAVREACVAAKINPAQLQRACVGVAGAGREEIAGVVRRIVAEAIPGEIEVVGDMEIALAAAFGEGPGVVVIAGTGSIAYGRDAQGKTARAGGWGFAISDEGSAHWSGRAAVAELLRESDQAADPGTETALPLFGQLKTAWKVDSLEQLARMANSNADFAALFPAVLAAADSDDVLAQRVLARAATELAGLAAIIVRRLFSGREPSDVPMAMAGGVFRHAAMVRERFYNEVRAAHPGVVLKSEVVEPVEGALRMARRAVS